MSHASRIASGAATYAGAAILQRAVPFLLLPLFTRILTPSEFGQVGILTTAAAAVTVVVGLGLESAVFRGYLRAVDELRSPGAFVATVGGFALLASIGISVFIAIALAPSLATLLGVPTNGLRFAAVGAALVSTSTLVPLALLRAQERMGDYLQLTGLQVVVTPILTVLFVAGLGWGATGWMLAYMLGAVTLLARGLVMIRRDWVLHFDVGHLRAALAFGLPLVPHGAAHWGLSVSDRAILGAFLPAADVGAYYAAYVLSLPVMLVAVAISQATQPLYVEAGTSRHGHARLSRLVTSHVLVTALAAGAVAVVGPGVQATFLPADYAPGAGLIPWLAVGAGLFGFYLVPMNVVTLTVGRTSRVWMITMLAAATNVGLNLALVPRFGILAAAVNTTIGYAILLIGVFLYARRVCDPPIHYEVGRVGLGLAMIGIPLAATALAIPTDTGLGLALRALATLAVVGVLLTIGPLREAGMGAMRAWRSAREGGQP